MAPATVTAYCMPRVYNEVTFICEWGWYSEHGVDEGENCVGESTLIQGER